MKHTMKIFTLLLALLMMLPLFGISVNAAETDKEYEMVLVMDVSGSMLYSDPNKMSMDASDMLADICASDERLYVSIVVFSDNAAIAAEHLDVSTENGKRTYKNIIKKIQGGTFSGMNCWSGATNTGAALELAESILNKSDVASKSLILFTDGKTEVSTSETTEESKTKAVEAAKRLGDSGIRVECVGLDVSEEQDKLDLVFLNSLSGTSGGETKECRSVTEIYAFFNRAYGRLTELKIDSNDVVVNVKPDVDTVHNEYIYGEVFNEVDVTFVCDVQISTFSVVSPSGKKVIDVNTSTGVANVDKTVCEYNPNVNLTRISIKLMRPEDGEWKFVMRAKQAGEVRISPVRHYAMSLSNTLTNGQQVGVGEKVTFVFKAHNLFTDKDVTNSAIYQASKQTVEITTPTGKIVNGEAKLNGAKNGFEYTYTFNEVGTYKIKGVLSHKEFDASSEITVKTIASVNPVITVTNSNGGVGEPVSLKLNIKDASGKLLTAIPDYLDGFRFVVDISCDGKKVDSLTVTSTEFKNGEATVVYTPKNTGAYTVTGNLSFDAGSFNASVTGGEFNVNATYVPVIAVPAGERYCREGAEILVGYKDAAGKMFDTLPAGYENADVTLVVLLGDAEVANVTIKASDFNNGEATYNFVPENIGEYTFKASVTVGGETLDSAIATVTFKKSSITVGAGVEGINQKGSESTASAEINIADLFTSPDGNALTYSVEASDPENVEATVEGTTLKINVKNYTDSTVKITATDAYGAEASYDIDIKVKSNAGLIIVIIIIVVILLVAVVILLLFVKKRSVAGMAFDVKITDNDSYKSMVYNVVNLARKKNSRSKMPLSKILGNEMLSGYVSGDMDAEKFDEFVATTAAKITVSGLVTKKGLSVAAAGKKKSFLGRSPISVNVGGFTVFVGKPGAFSDEF